jgi:radical SAM protein with 4Fe4S-binding SPASM domain
MRARERKLTDMKRTPIRARETLALLEKKGLRPPTTLTIAITGACNLLCSHCWVGAGTDRSAGHIPGRIIQRLLADFAELGGTGVRFTGGEPLCHPEWLDSLRVAKRNGFDRILLQTNGMLVKAEDAAALGGLDLPGLSIQVSLDGACARTHDLVRGEGSFRSLLDGLRLLVKAGLSRQVTIFFTEMHHNLAEIPDLLELADALGIGSVVTGALVEGGRASTGSPVAPATPYQYRLLLERYEADPRFRELYTKLGSVAAIEWLTADNVREECCTFAENPYLTPDGRLYPCLLCHADEFSVTGVFEKGLANAFAEAAPLWGELLETSRFRSAALAECWDCPGRAACAGGCMGRVSGSCGDLLAVDDRCRTRRSIYERKHLANQEIK